MPIQYCYRCQSTHSTNKSCSEIKRERLNDKLNQALEKTKLSSNKKELKNDNKA